MKKVMLFVFFCVFLIVCSVEKVVDLNELLLGLM